MQDKEIVLYGAGFEGEKFYWQYHDKYKIAFAVDQLNNRDFHGLQVYSSDEVLRGGIEKYQIVVAAVWETYLIIKKKLEGMGLTEFEHFTWSTNFGKKLCILYGNCHMRILEEYLCNNIYFIRNYIVRRFFCTYIPNACCLPDESELRNCDLLITQDIRDNSSNPFPGAQKIIKQVPDACRCITIPNLFGYNLFFPQGKAEVDLRGHIGRGCIPCEGKTKEELSSIEVRSRAYCIGDVNVVKLYQEGKGVEQIVKELEEAPIYPAEEIQKNFKEELQRIKERESYCDIRIANFIERNFQREKLFWDKNHPSKTVICEKGRRILQLLRVPVDETIPVRNELDCVELYIYGCVKRALGLKFEEQYMRRQNPSSLTNHPIDLYEYVEQSIRWV